MATPDHWHQPAHATSTEGDELLELVDSDDCQPPDRTPRASSHVVYLSDSI